MFIENIPEYLGQLKTTFPLVKLDTSRIESYCSFIKPLTFAQKEVDFLALPHIGAKDDKYVVDYGCLNLFVKTSVGYAFSVINQELFQTHLGQDLASTQLSWNHITQTEPVAWTEDAFQTVHYFEVVGIVRSPLILLAEGGEEAVQYLNELFFTFSTASRSWIDPLKSLYGCNSVAGREESKLPVSRVWGEGVTVLSAKNRFEPL